MSVSFFRTNVTILFDFQGEESVSKETAQEIIDALILKPYPDKIIDGAVRISVRVDKLKDKKRRHKLGVFTPDDVFPYLGAGKKDYYIGSKIYQVKMNNDRYYLFQKNKKCVSCGLEGTQIILEQQGNGGKGNPPHFNLYGLEDGRLVLMTKDHILAKSKGGKDSLDNYQTMCHICNNLKSYANMSIESVRELRRLYNQFKYCSTKKQLNIVIDQARKQLSV